ncbi:rod shape-determining protein MreC [Suttonella ornithocola]|uniref:Cell shape-determining protein MreC n=1 Tax=Suttonella ornithocola TaxID=279832 RepID=A0A380MTQ9_9GAMM|nr:rod shape-determining protein MreC [Suttonella ornithocola]SUO95446.1 rod shape-determining protein MreC [Suttonella ornithocola]
MLFPRPESRGRTKINWFRPWLIATFCWLTIVLLGKQTTLLQPVRHFLSSAVYTPVSLVLQSPLRFVSYGWSSWQHDKSLLANAKQLESENKALRSQVQLIGHYQAENRRLRMLMDSVGTVTEPVLIAELNDTDIEGYRESVKINRGKADGVYPQQAVIDPFGLVGQVTEVFEHEANVMLITDGRSRVPVYIERTHQRALVSGTTEKGMLAMSTLRLDSDIAVGDRLVSSGLGGVFPRGYPVAEVIAVSRDQRNSFLSVKLKPLAQLQSMLEVLLLDQRSVPESPILPMGPPAPIRSAQSSLGE